MPLEDRRPALKPPATVSHKVRVNASDSPWPRPRAGTGFAPGIEADRPALISQPWMDVMQRLILLDGFGVPKGVWGWVGGRLMGALNRPINELTVDLLDVRPRDRVLEIGY